MIDSGTLAELQTATQRHRMLRDLHDDLADIVARAIAMGDGDPRGSRGYYIGAAAAILARIDPETLENRGV